MSKFLDDVEALIAKIQTGNGTDQGTKDAVAALTKRADANDVTDAEIQQVIKDLATKLASSAPTVPVITALSPASGSINGGETVSLTGSGFTGATAVNFGTVAATSFSVVSDTSVTAVAPAQAAGGVDVIVTAPAGMSVAADADKYTYA